MFEASIEMSLSTKEHNVLEVSVIDVRIYSKQSLKDYLYDIDEVFGEGHSELTREYFLVV